MIYLASPYSHPDSAIRQQRFEAACRAAAALVQAGKTVFSPVVCSHCLCHFDLPSDWRFWQRHDRCHLEACTEVAVLMIDGWRESDGVKAEIAIARELGKPVTFLSAGDRPKEHSRRGEKEACRR